MRGVLWKAVDSERWSLHAQTKDEIEFIFSKAVEGLLDFTHNYSAFRKKSTNRYKIIFGDDKCSQDSSDYDDQQDDVHDNTFNNQRRYTGHPHNTSRNRHRYTNYSHDYNRQKIKNQKCVTVTKMANSTVIHKLLSFCASTV